MKNRDKLQIIISIIALKVILVVLGIFVTVESVYISNFLFFLLKLCDLATIIYLYKFIKIDKQQRLSMMPVILIIIPIVYFSITALFPIPVNREDITNNEIAVYQLLVSSPGLLNVIGQIILAIQLKNNQAEEYLRKPIRLVGSSFIAELVCFVVFMIVAFFIPHIMSFVGLLVFIPSVAMVNLYYTELKWIRRQE